MRAAAMAASKTSQPSRAMRGWVIAGSEVRIQGLGFRENR
jgi:hypothetical protein